MRTQTAIQAYQNYYKELFRYYEILGVLHWDLEVMLPSGAQADRSEQISLLSANCHKLFTSDEFTRLIEEAKEEVFRSSEPDSINIRKELELLEYERKREKKIPNALVEKFSKLTSLAHGIWGEAKKNKNFKEFEPTLTEIVSISKEIADYYGYETERYDALLENYEKGTTSNELEELFKHLKNSLIPIIGEAKSFPNPFKSPVPESYQKLFNEKLPAALGLPNDSHRLDVSLHPFSTSLGSKDKRITTRYLETDPVSSIFGVLHEAGHSLYELGIGEMKGYPSFATNFVSLGIHESQSRLWENQVGRSRAFWEYYYPILLKDFQIYHYDLPFVDFYSFINTVNKSKIRVEADQVTYNLHIILRFEVERELISKDLKVRDLPELWNSKMKQMFDIEIENDAEGVLQDVHWSGGSFGYFPTYTLGNIYSAQLFHAFYETHQSFWDDVRNRGDFSSLLKWLKERVHKKGKYFSPKELIRQATGELPDSEYLIRYLKSRVEEQG